MSIEFPSASPACPARMPSSEGVPVDVVGRPSMGEGRTPGGVGAGGVMGAEGEEGDASLSAGARVSAMLRLRKAIVVVRGLGGGEVEKLWEGGYR